MDDDDRQRFELLYAAHFDRVLAYALCRAGTEVAKEATSEVFLVAWRRLAEVPKDPLPWLLGVARRCLADQHRSSGRRDALSARLREGCGRPSYDGYPAYVVSERAQVLAALRRLAPIDRELLRLVAWDGLTAAQAAHSLALTLPDDVASATAVLLDAQGDELQRQEFSDLQTTGG